MMHYNPDKKELLARMIEEVLVNLFLVLLPACIVWLYMQTTWIPPINFTEIIELVVLGAISLFGMVRMLRVRKRVLLMKYYHI